MKELTMSGINLLEDQLNDEKKSAFDDRALIEDRRRQRDILQKGLDRAENNNRRLDEEKISKIKYMKEKENELSGLSKEMENLGWQVIS